LGEEGRRLKKNWGGASAVFFFFYELKKINKNLRCRFCSIGMESGLLRTSRCYPPVPDVFCFVWLIWLTFQYIHFLHLSICHIRFLFFSICVKQVTASFSVYPPGQYDGVWSMSLYANPQPALYLSYYFFLLFLAAFFVIDGLPGTARSLFLR
jgi:hypothetical protein